MLSVSVMHCHLFDVKLFRKVLKVLNIIPIVVLIASIWNVCIGMY